MTARTHACRRTAFSPALIASSISNRSNPILHLSAHPTGTLFRAGATLNLPSSCFLADQIAFRASSVKLALSLPTRKVWSRSALQESVSLLSDILDVVLRERNRGNVHDCGRPCAPMYRFHGVNGICRSAGFPKARFPRPPEGD